MLLTLGSTGCAGPQPIEPEDEPAVVVLDVKSPIIPNQVLPGTTLILTGKNFNTSALSLQSLNFQGMIKKGNRSQNAQFAQLLKVISPTRAELLVSESFFNSVGEGMLEGMVDVRTQYAGSDRDFSGRPQKVTLQFVRQLKPQINTIQCSNGESECVYLNTKIKVNGDGILLGGNEGETWAELPTLKGSHLFRVQPVSDGDRQQGYFEYYPDLAQNPFGSVYSGQVRLINKYLGQKRNNDNGDLQNVQFKLEKTYLRPFPPHTIASLGRFWNFTGKGFIQGMKVHFEGQFIPRTRNRSLATPIPMAFDIAVNYLDGERANFILPDPFGSYTDSSYKGDVLKGVVNDPQENYGAEPTVSPKLHQLHQRRYGGTLIGRWTPILKSSAPEIKGIGTLENDTWTVIIGGVRQVAWVQFIDNDTWGWNIALEKYGLTAADALIRKRVIDAVQQPYKGTNIFFTATQPKDVPDAHLAVVYIMGHNPDPDMELMGLDATYGKDSFNRRLNDIVGNYNDDTKQKGGNPYGGVFVEPMNWTFSTHPWKKIKVTTCPSSIFDDIFDPFIPEIGTPLTSEEVKQLKELTTTAGCLTAANRLTQAACAVLIMGNMVANVMAHEFAHTLGLSQPHNPNIGPYDIHSGVGLMNGSCGRPLNERAELNGEGPSQFCSGEFEYLQQYLPPDPLPDSSQDEFEDPYPRRSDNLYCPLR